MRNRRSGAPRFDATSIPRRKIGAARDAYNTMVSGRPTASGIRDAGGAIDPFDRQGDGTYAVNPWTHARNMDPYRGDVAIKDYNGETSYVPFWQADRTFSANLGLTGFNDITEQLRSLSEEFSANLDRQTEYGYQNLAEQTDSKFIPMDRAGERRRWG